MWEDPVYLIAMIVCIILVSVIMQLVIVSIYVRTSTKRYKKFLNNESFSGNYSTRYLSEPQQVLTDLEVLIDKEVDKAFTVAVMKNYLMQQTNEKNTVYTITEKDKNVILKDTYEKFLSVISDNLFEELLFFFKDRDSIENYILDEMDFKLNSRIITLNNQNR